VRGSIRKPVLALGRFPIVFNLRVVDWRT